MQSKDGQPQPEHEQVQQEKVYSTREFRRSNSGQSQGQPQQEKSKTPSKDEEVSESTPKKSGKSYASKRKERQQMKEASTKRPSNDGILDLPSE